MSGKQTRPNAPQKDPQINRKMSTLFTRYRNKARTKLINFFKTINVCDFNANHFHFNYCYFKLCLFILIDLKI